MRKLRGSTSASARRLVLRALANLTDDPAKGGTPIDTEHARSNWVPSIGTPYTGISGSRKSVSYAAQSAGVAAVQRYRIEQGSLFLANNVPYLAYLDQGSSQQAPAGFVEKAINAAVAAETAVRDLERALGGGR